MKNEKSTGNVYNLITDEFQTFDSIMNSAEKLAESRDFQNKYKALGWHGSSWLVCTHQTKRKEGLEEFLNGSAKNLVEIEESKDGLVFSKHKPISVCVGDVLFFDFIPSLKFNSYGMMYDVIEEALQILCKKDFDGDVK